jgi:putative PEP-CTERM system histidine kinase
VTSFLLLPFLAAALSVVLAFAGILRKKPSLATWCFFAGMLALALDSAITGFTLRAADLREAVGWLTTGLVVETIIPATWLGFAVTYSRGDHRESLRRWRVPILLIGIIPVTLSVLARDQLFRLVTTGAEGEARLVTAELTRALNIVLLVGLVLVLMNVEQTFRSAVGAARWQIKFVMLGLGAIFGARIYVHVQTVLFAAPDIAFWSVESGGLLIGCVFLTVAYTRTGFAEIDVYPSLAVLRSSITVLLVGGYLMIVGVMAQVARRFGGAESFQLQTFVVLLGISGLALLLLSDRARQRIHLFAARHFSKAGHDSLAVWTALSERLARVHDPHELGGAAVKLISETFDALSVTLWLVDTESRQLKAIASTAPLVTGSAERSQAHASPAIAAGLAPRTSPFDLDAVESPWAEQLRRLNPTTFSNGGSRWCVPLNSGGHGIGALVLADRVNGAPYSLEELELLKCIGDHITSVLLNLRLAGEVASAKELEAFQTMSTFFVHDLKNAAASLNLTLRNLPVHFDDPAFRADALRGMGNTTRRIEEMIGRLSAFRQQPALTRTDTDVNQLITDTLAALPVNPDIQFSTELQPLPLVAVDRHQIGSVLTNLLMNAIDASGAGGVIGVRTEHQDGRVLVLVSDTGCGMSGAFIQDQLFRPFQSTKKHGLGIGLFQSRAVVHAHGGGIHVTSEPGQGTTFTVSLPVSPRQ